MAKSVGPKIRERTRRVYVTPEGQLAGSDGQRITEAQRTGKARLARIASVPLLSAEDVERALTGYYLGMIEVNEGKLAALKLLGERHGLWGPGRKTLAPSPDKPAPQPFSVADEPEKP